METDSKVSVPLFTPIAAPRITSTSHAALVQWRKARKEYVEIIQSRCATTGEDPDKVITSVKHSFENSLLSIWCDLKWKTTVEEITDDQIMKGIEQVISEVKNKSIPDIQSLFRHELNIDLESDVNERIIQYFRQCRQVIQDNGLQTCFDTDEGKKERCKLLIASLEPVSLRDEIEAMVKFQHREAKDSEEKLFELILSRALEQERCFLQAKKRKLDRGAKNRAKSSDSETYNKQGKKK